MMDVDIKRGWFKNIEGDKLEQLMVENFRKVEKEGDKLISHFGAMQPITVVVKNKSTLAIDIITDKDVDDETAMETIRAKNKFLEAATGFTAKQRSKRLQKKAKEGKI